MAAHNEPTGGVREHQCTDGDNQGEEDLERNGESPLDGLLDVGETEDDPVGDEGTDGNQGTLEADKQTTVVRGRTLGLPDGNSSGVQTVANTRDDTADNELAETPLGTEGRGRDGGTDDQDGGTSDNEASAANGLTVEHGEERTEETADFVTGSNTTTQNVDVLVGSDVGVLGGSGRHGEDGELNNELSTGDETRHHTLVVSEEGETHNGREGDGPLQGLARQSAS